MIFVATLLAGREQGREERRYGGKREGGRVEGGKKELYE